MSLSGLLSDFVKLFTSEIFMVSIDQLRLRYPN